MSVPFSALGAKSSGDVGADIEAKVLEQAKTAKEAQEAADHLKYQATCTEDQEEKERLLAEATEKEKEAKSASKAARRIASGAWQGTLSGVGIGSGVGAGVGTVVGTLVGTIAAIPMAGLGALVGLPVGLIHGPFFKPDGGGGGDEGSKKDEGPSEDEQHEAVIKAVNNMEEQTGKENDKKGD
ncbi:hypothetical protein S7711_10446 [Stachybotrys chartarum IBT 7711]|uniref:Uncharacterized protein n=1 Tax=Stachybotrys chartarum (strain CBS 109288 / IBT 7711) TaxID=1280523 RepID=A0A084BBQ3_STACB|nr:hypothetical protein S7711_10446 [Stachybotrys chartarum IBT 7711]